MAAARRGSKVEGDALMQARSSVSVRVHEDGNAVGRSDIDPRSRAGCFVQVRRKRRM